MRFILAALLIVFANHSFAETVNSAGKSDQLISVHNRVLYDAGTYAPSAPVTARMLMADANTSTTTNTQTPTQPDKVTTIVQGGTWVASILDWVKVALVPVIGSALVALFIKAMAFAGIQIAAQQSSQLQNIAINGLNEAMDKIETVTRGNPKLDFDVKNQVIAEAIRYTQVHASDTIKAMGLDPESGQAVEKIRAKILTVINDPSKPTPPALTPPASNVVPM